MRSYRLATPARSTYVPGEHRQKNDDPRADCHMSSRALRSSDRSSLAVRAVPKDLPTTAHPVLKFPTATRFRWISLIFSEPIEPIRSRNRVTTKRQPIVFPWELTLVRPRNGARLNRQEKKQCLSLPL